MLPNCTTNCCIAMNLEGFRKRGNQMIEYICDYLTNIESRRVMPDVAPGYLRKLLPEEAPQDPEDWEDIMDDVENKIMIGITHWQHPGFHAYFPSGNSIPSILGDMLSDAIGCIGFSWAASPACTELESIVMDWFAKAIGLPKEFMMSTKGGKGGGALETSASECVLLCMLAARNLAISHLKLTNPQFEDSSFLPKLVAYCSKESHSCVEKAAKILLVKLRILESDDKCSLRGSTLEKVMKEDEELGLLPFFVSSTLGTTSSCAFDNLEEIGPVCKRRPCTWLHVDGAYAGNSFICPELKGYLNGVEHADSFNTNPNKWLLVAFDCSCLWLKNKDLLLQALVVNPLYLQHAKDNEAIDYRHWGIPLSRRFRALKLWFVMRTYGISGLQSYIRRHIKLAKYFESLVLKDERFEVMNEVQLGLVCFRLKGSNTLNQTLLDAINASGKLHMVPAMIKDIYVIRFCVTKETANEAEIDYAWKVISEYASIAIGSLECEETSEKLSLHIAQQHKQFSFTKRVSKGEINQVQRSSFLSDECIDCVIVDSDDEAKN